VRVIILRDYSLLPGSRIPVSNDFGANLRHQFLNLPTGGHYLSRLCRYHIELTRVTEIRLTNLAAAVQLLLKNSRYQGTVSDVTAGRYNYEFGGRPTTRETVILQGPVEPDDHPWFRWLSECAELYETLALCPSCQINFSPSFSSSSSLDPLLLPWLNAPPLVFALLAHRLSPFPLVLLGVADPLNIP